MSNSLQSQIFSLLPAEPLPRWKTCIERYRFASSLVYHLEYLPFFPQLTNHSFWPLWSQIWGRKKEKWREQKRLCEWVLVSSSCGELLILFLLWDSPWVLWRTHPHSSARMFHPLSLTWVMHSPPGLLRIYPLSTVSWHSSSTYTFCNYTSQGSVGQSPFK